MNIAEVHRFWGFFCAALVSADVSYAVALMGYCAGHVLSENISYSFGGDSDS